MIPHSLVPLQLEAEATHRAITIANRVRCHEENEICGKLKYCM